MRKVFSYASCAICMVGLLGAAPVAADARLEHSQIFRSPLENARGEIESAVAIARTMERDRSLRELMAKADGIFIMTSFGRVAYGVGARGGEGILLIHASNGEWGDPIFYDLGGLSVGIQAGIAGGHAVFLLMNSRAVGRFRNPNNFSLNADAGLTIVNYSAAAQTVLGKGDVIFWTDAIGAYIGADVSATDIVWNGRETRAFYGDPHLSQQAIFRGWYKSGVGSELRDALPL